jgi:hypothetical protein
MRWSYWCFINAQLHFYAIIFIIKILIQLIFIIKIKIYFIIV